jgi:hypothetical protein
LFDVPFNDHILDFPYPRPFFRGQPIVSLHFNALPSSALPMMELHTDNSEGERRVPLLPPMYKRVIFVRITFLF